MGSQAIKFVTDRPAPLEPDGVKAIGGRPPQNRDTRDGRGHRKNWVTTCTLRRRDSRLRMLEASFRLSGRSTPNPQRYPLPHD
jgi:hypothetical protein